MGAVVCPGHQQHDRDVSLPERDRPHVSVPQRTAPFRTSGSRGERFRFGRAYVGARPVRVVSRAADQSHSRRHYAFDIEVR